MERPYHFITYLRSTVSWDNCCWALIWACCLFADPLEEPPRRPLVLAALALGVRADAACRAALAFGVRARAFVWACSRARLAFGVRALESTLACTLALSAFGVLDLRRLSWAKLDAPLRLLPWCGISTGSFLLQPLEYIRREFLCQVPRRYNRFWNGLQGIRVKEPGFPVPIWMPLY